MEAKKILIVDDDVDLVNLLSRKILQAGYEVLAAYDGYQAVRLAHKENPDLIILDIKLPAGGGLGVLNNLKNSFKTQNIPIIAITAFDDPDIKNKVIKYNVGEFMLKPLDPEALLEKIKKHLQEY